MPVTPAIFKKLACLFQPVSDPSPHQPPAEFRAARPHFAAGNAFHLFQFSHQIRLLCNRPAVSTISTSEPRAFAAFIESKKLLRISFLLLLNQRHASPFRQDRQLIARGARTIGGANQASLPSALIRCASLPIVVVLPTPFTPTISSRRERYSRARCSLMRRLPALSGRIESNSDLIACLAYQCHQSPWRLIPRVPSPTRA